MTNDAKLGMLAGVLGVIVAAVLLSSAPPRGAESPAGTNAQPNPTQDAALPAAASTSVSPDARPTARTAAPVPQTRKAVTGQPTSLANDPDEEP